MTPIIYQSADKHPIAILIKGSAFNSLDIQSHYVTKMVNQGINIEDICAFPLAYHNNKVTAKQAGEYIDSLLPGLTSLGVNTLYVADAAYFKKLTKETKAEVHLGYVLPCAIKGYEHISVVYGVNYQSVFYNPDLKNKLNRTIHTLASHISNTHTDPGLNIIANEYYPREYSDIEKWLNNLHQYDELCVDTEAFSLKVPEAGLGTIGFSWNDDSGVVIPVDYHELTFPDAEGNYGINVKNKPIRALLKKFFENYKGNIVFHNATFDLKVLISALWLDGNLKDYPAMLEGLEVLTRSFDDTKIIAYLATNTTAGNELGLKVLAQEFAGNFAQDEINDIRKIPLATLLRYNLVDCLSTNYVKNKYHPMMVKDNQEDIYNTMMLPSAKLITQIELTGLPLAPDKVELAKSKLTSLLDSSIQALQNDPLVLQTEEDLKKARWEKDFENRRSKAKNPDKIKPKDYDLFPLDKFNPNSDDQKRYLMYEIMGLDVLDVTDSKKPATNKRTIDKLLNIVTDPKHINILSQLKQIGEVSIMLSTFIPAFEAALDKGDNVNYLLGNFNIGGTKSGRLSSSNPNLQNIPAASTYAKWIKECFTGAHGWLFVGADFNSLEDYISALTTKDPNKLAVYIKGFDGHCLRAAYYFRDKLEHIDLDSVVSVNSIAKTHGDLRQLSKAPTFALTYQGTWVTLVRNVGFSKELAQSIEANYHELYKVSDEYVQSRLKQACSDGYVDVAFGLRLRTPLLSQVDYDYLEMMPAAAAESRTAGNALGQSYGLLNNRAAVAFMKKVWASEFRYDILPVALIHDAIYLHIRDDIRVVKFVNDNLIKEMQWQELPEIQHETVKIGAALDIFWPNWANAITIENNSTEQEIIDICKKGKADYLAKNPTI